MKCSCDFDPDYHRDRNGDGQADCRNEVDPNPSLVGAPSDGTPLCLPCLYGCAP